MPITTTPSGGPQGDFSTYTPIFSTTMPNTVSSITFSNIPTTFTDLVIVATVNASGAGQNLQYRFNGDSSANYSLNFIRYNSGSFDATRVTNQTTPQIDSFGTMNATANGFTQYKLQIMNYSNTNTFKGMLAIDTNGSAGADITAHLWRNVSPITSITFYGASTTIVAGSTFTIYGIKAAAPAPKATGGDVVTTDGTYWYHAFKNTGLFDVKQSLTADVLVVGGGGGGSTGGGGGGQFGTFTSQSISTATLVTVGAGGAGGTDSTVGSNGGSSQFGALTASIGGGGGGTLVGSNGVSGASGGGGGCNDAGGFSGGSGTAGNTGGSGSGRNGGSGGGGGGGGAGGSGGNAGSGNAGSGGTGTYSVLSNSLSGPTNSGQLSGGNYYYAGGGGGGANLSTQGTGGLGGGGNGYKATPNTAGSSGTENTGGGGGATWNQGRIYHGGSGIVIVRYAV